MSGSESDFYVSDLTDWSPKEAVEATMAVAELAELKPVLGPLPQPDESSGFWELTYHTDVREVPSLYELVGVLAEWRPQVIDERGASPISIRWRAP